MIKVDKSVLKFILAGRAVQVQGGPSEKPCRYHRERTYAVGVTQGKTICRVEVLTVSQAASGWELKVKLATIDTPRLLAQRSEYGYTSDPHRALRGEPESMDMGMPRHWAQEASRRHDAATSERQLREQAKTLSRRLREGTIVASKAGRNITEQLAEIERQLREIERRDAA